MQPNIFMRLFYLKLKLLNISHHLVDFGIRVWISIVFFKSGILKLPNGFLGIGKGSWDSTLYLFEFEHPVPLIPVKIAAIMGTSFEILCPLFLILGLGTRFASAILLIMTAFIELTYQHDMQHIYWMILCAVMMTHGAGNLSIDSIIKNKSENNTTADNTNTNFE